MTLKSLSKGVKGVVINRFDADGGRKAIVAILASKNGDVEASIDELLENGRAEVASGLGKIQGSAFWKGCGMKNEMDELG